MLTQPPVIPRTPGVYTFLRRTTPLYIGKAADLKKRLVSYWRKNTGQKIARLRNEATHIEWTKTPSEIDALLKEAELIKKHRPKYNVLLRDDKNYSFVGITHEKFPKIFVTHQPITRAQNKKQYIGPFTSASALKITLRLLRKIFPYCTCAIPHTRPCLNAHIGRCFGFCCNKNTLQISNHTLQNDYTASIKNLIMILGGKKRGLLKKMKQDMRTAAHAQNFERAAKIRDHIAGIENVFEHRHVFKHPIQTLAPDWNTIEKNIQSFINTKEKISRVEGYDISNIQGTAATGSMVVFRDGKHAKSEYRKFRIKTVCGISDVDMHKEVIRRRLLHPEWPFPDLMVIDGGKPQLNAVKTALKFQIPNSKFKILLTALAKREEELYIEGRSKPIRLDTLPPATKFFFQRVRDESHRFAKKYHHKLREMSYRGNVSQ